MECEHLKVYAPYILASNPPQTPWICSKCGLKGRDVIGVYEENKYAEIEKQFKETKE